MISKNQNTLFKNFNFLPIIQNKKCGLSFIQEFCSNITNKYTKSETFVVQGCTKHQLHLHSIDCPQGFRALCQPSKSVFNGLNLKKFV